MSTAILTQVLQSTVFAVLIGLFAQGFRSSAARVRYWLWCAASVKFLLPLSWLALLRPSLNWQPEHPAVASALASAAERLATPFDVTAWTNAATWMDEPASLRAGHEVGVWLIASIWLAGVCFVALRWVATWLQMRAIAQAAAPLAVSFPIPVRSSTAVREPGVFGIFRPVLLLPQGMHSQLTPEQFRTILAHEHAHVRRRDNLTAAIHMLVQTLFWFHPLVWWIGRNLLQERERACDEAVLDAGHDRIAYAAAIINVCEQLTSPRVMCVAGMSGSGLAGRIEAIVKAQLGTSPGAIRTCILVLGIVVIAALSALFGAPSPAAALARDESEAPLHLSEILLRPSAGTRPDPWVGTIDGKLTLLNMPLKTLIDIAHRTGYQPVVDGPRWLDLRYDLQVSGDYPAFDPNTSPKMMRRIVRQIVDDKLALVAKRESRPLGVFVMRVAPEGLNPLAFKPYVRDRLRRNFGGPATMPGIAWWLRQKMNHFILDRTGVTDEYVFVPWAIKTDWRKVTPETLPAAAREIGLQLDFVIEPVDVFAIVRIRQPVANWQSESR